MKRLLILYSEYTPVIDAIKYSLQELAEVVCAEKVPEKKDKYDLIITNPPIRAGKAVLLEILGGAKDHLNKSGECWFVMRKDHGVKSMIKTLENSYICEIIDKSKGFYVVKLKIKENTLTTD